MIAKIEPGNIYAVAVQEMPPECIDHHDSDLYLMDTPEARSIITRMKNKALLSRFTSPIDNRIWFEFPFCYTPFWGQVERGERPNN